MKTFLTQKKIAQKAFLLVTALQITLLALSQSGTGGGSGGGSNLKFENPQLQSGAADLQLGARYLFSNVANNVDAIVRIDSMVNGAKVNKIDDNSNGTGYKEAFQPAVQSGGIIGMSYAVFRITFYAKGDTTTPIVLPIVNATALDLDGNSTLKELAEIRMGNGSSMNYMMATPDISVSQVLTGNFMGVNILGIERTGIDTSSLANMFTTSNSGISSFSVKYGSFTSQPSNPVRQFSLYMKRFDYPGNVLPVKLTSFSAMLTANNKVDLKWSTVTEINLNHFIVERSTDGINYSDAAMVFATGNSAEKINYAMSDNISSMQAGIIYYRLRSVDTDGKNQLSEVRVIRIGKATGNSITIQTYPNPVTSDLRITIPANWQNKKLVYEVITLNGQSVKRTEAANSSQTETINVSSLAPGMYLVRVNCEGQTAQQKIIKH